MKKSIILWLIAFLITIGTSVFQRLTGPTHPISGTIEIDGTKIKYNLLRSHSTSKDYQVKLKTNNQNLSATLIWKRYKLNENWNEEQMNYDNGNLIASIPAQPAAGKVEYKIKLISNNNETYLPIDKRVVIRFRDDVPLWALIPHIIFIFSAMMLSTRTALEYFNQKKYNNFIIATIVFLILGGFIFGPIVQKYAFGAFWTGIPFGYDLTDNKVLVALIFWLIVLFKRNNPEKLSKYVIIAAIITLIAFLIPHSLLGSELDYNTNKMKNVF